MPEIESSSSDSWCFSMRPWKPSRRDGDVFSERLDAIIDIGHPLVRPGELVSWSDFDDSFRRFYKPIGRPFSGNHPGNYGRTRFLAGAASQRQLNRVAHFHRAC
jgi:hypothetical protein